MTIFTTCTGRPDSSRYRTPLIPVAALLIPFLWSGALAQDDRWDDSFGWNGVVGEVLAIDAGECDMYIGGRFSPSDNYVARYDGSGFSRLGDGSIDGAVHAVVVDGSEVYIGGDFTSIGEVEAAGIARWNGIGWEEIGGDVAGGGATVHDIALFGSDIFIAGNFTSVDGTPALNIARWNGITGGWSGIGSGVDGTAYDLHVQGDWLYVGGRFANAGGVSTSNIVRFNLINQSWQRLGNGLNDTVRAIAVTDRYVYATGDFTHSSLVELNHIGVFDRGTSDWSPMEGGADAPGYDLLLQGGDLYAVGSFTRIGGVTTTGAARWDGSAWQSLGDGLDGTARALAACAERICVGGDFQSAGSIPSPWLAAWEDGAWSSLAPQQNNGLNRPSRAVAFLPESQGGEFFAGGEFTMAGGTPADHIAFWNGSRWEAMGSGVDGPVYGLATDGNIVVVGGLFERSGGIPLGNIGFFDLNSRTWEPMGEGINGAVNTLLIDGDMVYIGGEFTSADGMPASNLAAYNLRNESWEGLGQGVNGPVYTLALDGGRLHVGGDFSSAGGTPSGNYATFDLPTDAWTPLSPGMDAPVRAIEVTPEGLIYVGGDFTRVATASYDRPVDHVAINDGFEWRGLEGGLEEGVRVTTVYDIVAEGESVFFGGEFTLAGGVPIGYLARWRESWVPLGSGIDGVLPVVYDLDAADGLLAVAGAFSRAGNHPSVNIALWDDRPGHVAGASNPYAFEVRTRTSGGTLYVTIIPGSDTPSEGRIGLSSVNGERLISPIEIRLAPEGTTVAIDRRHLPSGTALLYLETTRGVGGQVIAVGR